MPHFHIDYSPNLEERLDIAGFCDTVRVAAIETGVFPVAILAHVNPRCESAARHSNPVSGPFRWMRLSAL